VPEPAPFVAHKALARLYPEVLAGGFTRHDGFVEFFARINALLPPQATILDFGAGRGAWTDAPLAPYHRDLRDFARHGHTVVGTDVDPVVLENPKLQEAYLVPLGAPLPVADARFDLLVADHVLEHVTRADAPGVAAEIGRVLKPGGWFAARTPNKWGMIAAGARLVPNTLHAKVLTLLQPGRQERDVFPTQYAMNTIRDLRRLFPESGWRLVVYRHASEPQYVGRSVLAWRAASFIDRLTPPPLQPTLMIFAQKR
jgi:SAM-dependent methyltransferase